MLNPLKLKMFICKMITCWIGPSGKRKLIREFLFWFSIKDYHRFKNADYAIVSLGNSCLTRVLAVASGVKPRRFYGEKSCPFDLCRSNDVKRIVELIENNFSDFFKNINLDDFPHDDKLTLRQFKKRYQRRIKNFLELQKSDKRIYYIYSDFNSMQPDVRDLKNLYRILKSKRGEKHFELILVLPKPIDMPDVIQITYDINLCDGKSLEYIINRYREYNNECTKFRDRAERELKRIITRQV